MGVNEFKKIQKEKGNGIKKADIINKIKNIEDEYKKQLSSYKENYQLSKSILKSLNPHKKSRFYKLVKSIDNEIEAVDAKYKELSLGIDERVVLTRKMKRLNERLLNLGEVYQR